MPGKPKDTRYGEFRVFVEWMRKGKFRIRREFIPSLAAWLLMLGRRYEKMAQGMRDKLAVKQIPGLEESARVMEICTQHIQRLLNTLPENFDKDDWISSVSEICALMDITPTTTPIQDIPEGQFEHTITETEGGSDTSGERSNVHLRSSTGKGDGNDRNRNKPRRPS